MNVPAYPWIHRPLEGRFYERLNRFACQVAIDGQPTRVFLPNSGRLEELLRAGARVTLEKRRDQGKTHHDLLLVETPRFPDGRPIWAGLDSRLPPKLVAWALAEGLLPGLEGVQAVRPEVRVKDVRLDLQVETPAGVVYAETKSVNLVDSHGSARFPDAPTSRGARHVETLARLRRKGYGALLIFVVLREDARSFAPFSERDPEFSAAVLRAHRQGVGVLAVQFAAGPSMGFLGTLPVQLSPPPFPGFWPPLRQDL